MLGRPEAFILGVISEEGVVGWVERASEGGCDVRGVSRAGMSREGSSTGGGASTGNRASSGMVSTSPIDPRRGSSTGALDDCGAGGFLLFRDTLGGKAPSNDCQGRGG